MLTAELIRSLAPRARQDYVDAMVNGAETFARYGITTPERMAAFLASCLHETGGLTILRESMVYTNASRIAAVWPTRFTASSAASFVRSERKLANSVYGSRMGNQRNGINDDDGFRFRGASLMQTTGYDNYKRIGDAIGVDLGTHPELIENATVGLMAACHEFQNFLSYCDMGERGWRAVCNGINRGNPASTLDPIGWSDRQLWYKRCCDALGITGKVEDDTLRVGDQGPIVKAFQERLAGLGYALGRADGIFGSRMRAAVLAFQAENSIATDGVIGAQTRAALNSETAIAMPAGERATETIADLREKGSKTIAAADTIKQLGAGAAILGGLTGTAQQSGVVAPPVTIPAPDLLPFADGTLKDLTLLRTITNGFTDVFTWAASHWWLLLIVGGFFAWKLGRDIQWRRLLEHNIGLNLSK